MSEIVDRENLFHTVQSCPAVELPLIIHAATGAKIAEAPIEMGKVASTYFLHADDRTAKMKNLEEIFEESTTDEVVGEIRWAHDAIQKSEARTREHRPNDPYWFVSHQIAGCRSRLSEGDASGAFAFNLHEHNHGHSGFTGIARRVYFSPRNDEERRLSGVIRQLHIDVATAMLKETKPTSAIMEYMDVEMIIMCVCRLGKDVPEDLSAGLITLLEDCAGLANPWRSAQTHLEEMTARFA